MNQTWCILPKYIRLQFDKSEDEHNLKYCALYLLHNIFIYGMLPPTKEGLTNSIHLDEGFYLYIDTDIIIKQENISGVILTFSKICSKFHTKIDVARNLLSLYNDYEQVFNTVKTRVSDIIVWIRKSLLIQSTPNILLI